ncbi:hypothetical protein CJ010_01685 [Azoarcus sp. DD4]|uniref:DUF3240 family protein n=1 Tax=Azoarcus sp. DD4 TaxID=2027405 RepID=UPI00112D1A7A|nr:DUF3240 family protein [Azoarcus sp. DD4]QDF95351.1 hypothetical protein CJ010_01685 [Azoarcus sp. DD4]
MTAKPDSLLTLIAPAALEDNLVDLLLALPAMAGGFTTHRADGHGREIALVGANENVRGRGDRVCIRLALQADAVQPLLAELRAALPDANVFYWLTPLIDCGRLS